jgi:hypothetical protein
MKLVQISSRCAASRFETRWSVLNDNCFGNILRPSELKSLYQVWWCKNVVSNVCVACSMRILMILWRDQFASHFAILLYWAAARDNTLNSNRQCNWWEILQLLAQLETIWRKVDVNNVERTLSVALELLIVQVVLREKSPLPGQPQLILANSVRLQYFLSLETYSGFQKDNSFWIVVWWMSNQIKSKTDKNNVAVMRFRWRHWYYDIYPLAS